MGRARITGGGTDGLYTIRIERDQQIRADILRLQAVPEFIDSAAWCAEIGRASCRERV